VSAPTIEEQIAAARREASMRRRVYPRWIEAGRMTQSKADHEIACMEAIVASLEGIAPKAPEQGALL